MKDCCKVKPDNRKKGLWQGLMFGIIPHSFCILFVVFSVFGAVFATEYLKKFLIIPQFFTYLVILSFIFALIAASIYLFRAKEFNLSGIKNNWKYLTILFSFTIILNVLFVYVVFPSLANINQEKTLIVSENSVKTVAVKVDIPCPGHAPLVISELKKNPGVNNVEFIFPDKFNVSYNISKTNESEILKSSIFESFKATKL